ncbi:MAG: tRNA 2-thiocytidine(32) synthetase TtcA [Chlorobi bacterium]|nr:tRNA 2-thiocytidine(32) synthetase TtcA [Chlorobiota bacterium]
MQKADKRFLEKIRRKVADAVRDYGLIRPGDRILVALSGGKDSTVLLDALHNRMHSLGIPYTLAAATVDLTDVGYAIDTDKLKAFCEERDIPLTILKDDMKITEGPKHPCFYCAWNRRRLLFQYADASGFGKVAFGHNRDDAVETFLMNMIYHAEGSAFPAKLDMFGGRLQIIRPLLYVSNAEAERYVSLIGYEPVPYNCPYARDNDREKFRNLLRTLHGIHPRAGERIFEAMHRIRPEYLPRREKSD